MINIPEVSVITTTHKRHKQLIHCIEAVRRQSVRTEHIVVSDGLDPEVEEICRFYQVRCVCLEKEERTGSARGHPAKDAGIKMATGTYICLWDDDNLYYDTALRDLYETAQGHDIGVCEAIYYKKHRSEECPDIFFALPRNWTGEFVIGDIDTMNVCVSSKIAKKVMWSETDEYEGDYVWLSKLRKRFNASINFKSTIVGIKL